jgi:hydrogenase maturation factor
MTTRPEGCTTCGDRAVAATVVAVEGVQALVSVQGRLEQVAVELIPDVAPGDLILCHASVALACLDHGA